MKKLLLLPLAVAAVLYVAGVVPPQPVEASENLVASLNDAGALIRTFHTRGLGMRNLTFQCPGQVVYARAGCPGCTADAAVGDVLVDFTSGPDSYPFPLDRESGQDRIHFKRFDAGVLECYVYQVAQ